MHFFSSSVFFFEIYMMWSCCPFLFCFFIIRCFCRIFFRLIWMFTWYFLFSLCPCVIWHYWCKRAIFCEFFYVNVQRKTYAFSLQSIEFDLFYSLCSFTLSNIYLIGCSFFGVFNVLINFQFHFFKRNFNFNYCQY